MLNITLDGTFGLIEKITANSFESTLGLLNMNESRNVSCLLQGIIDLSCAESPLTSDLISEWVSPSERFFNKICRPTQSCLF